jgi:signal transduction histidine kinase
MNRLFANFLHNYTFQRQLGITIALGIFMLALLSSVVGAWFGNERVRNNLLEQGRNITQNLARQSVLALIYASSDNAAEAAMATLDFPGVIGVEIRDIRQHVLLKRGNVDPAEFSPRAGHIAGTEEATAVQTAAELDAESPNAWRFTAPVNSQSTGSPFNEMVAPELLGNVTVIISKKVLTQMTTSIFVANMVTSFSFALLFLLLIRVMSNRMTQPLNQLSESMGRAEAGESQVRAELAGPKDIADMAHAFNNMMTVLEARTAEIGQLNAELERRVAERTVELEAANKELEAFSYSVSHDLRTPLRAIDGYSHILLEEYANKLDDEATRLLNVVRNNTIRMGQLIDDILKFSRTGRLELTFSEMNMDMLAQDVLEELKPSISESKLQVTIDHLPAAKGDSAMMHQVLVNLMTNAIKFSRNSETPRIHVGATVKDDETIYFVKDNGVGFDMQYADKLFGVFQRLHSMEEFEGTGIGLAIVKRIVTRHGGRVWAESKLNEGATIYFSLPGKEMNHE